MRYVGRAKRGNGSRGTQVSAESREGVRVSKCDTEGVGGKPDGEIRRAGQMT